MRRFAPIILLALLLGGCGLNVKPADLFLLQRQGGSSPLSALVSDGGTVRCNGGPARAISNAQLIDARDVAAKLADDAKAHLALAPRPGSVYRYAVRVQDGTVRFADNATAGHWELSRAQLVALQLCG